MGVGADKAIPTALHGLLPFRLVTESQARHLKPIGLFLNAPRIGQNETSHRLQEHHVEVRDRIDLGDSLTQLDGMQAELLLSPRMYWKDHPVPGFGQPNESCDNAFKPLRLIGVLRSVHCRQNIPLRLYDKTIKNR
jgi:hypothetical protein